MATSYLNTSILGQVSGGSLTVGGLADEYRTFRDEVQTKKRSISGITAAEREMQRKKREERLKQSQETTAIVEPNDPTKVIQPGIAIDTADIAPPVIPVEKTATPAVQAKQDQVNKVITEKKATIVKAPVTQKATPPPPKPKLAPEKQYTDADRAFASAWSAYEANILSKNQSDVNKGRGTLQGQLQAVVDTAKATGRQNVISAVGSINGILGQKHISSQNVGQAKASTTSAKAAIRGEFDIDSLLKDIAKAAPAPPAAPAQTVTATVRGRAVARTLTSSRVRGGNPFRNYDY